MAVYLKDLEMTYPDGTEAVKRVNLEVKQGEFVTLLGPSGCGKSTTLRLIAGLERATAGSVFISDRDVTAADPGDRDVAMVFQSYALYPHMTVLENMTLNLTVAGMSKQDAFARATATATTLGIEGLLQRKPAKLSGGQRQRVALGRAMVRRPACYLMDEPLSNLDLKLREKTRTELKRLHQRDQVTTIYVTHDQAEALILSDRIVVMQDGVIQQIADPRTIYENPANVFVADFIGSPGINFIEGRGVPGQVVTVAGSSLADGATMKMDGSVMVGIRPEDVIVGAPDSGIVNGTVDFIEPYGGVVFAFITTEPTANLLNGREHVVAGLEMRAPIKAGDAVGLSFRGSRAVFFDSEQGNRIVA